MAVPRRLPLLVLLLAAAEPGAADRLAAGKSAYERYCVECHHVTLRGTGHGPALDGEAFRNRWAAKSSAELASYLRTQMASTVPSSVGVGVYVDMAEYLLQRAGVEGGAGEAGAQTWQGASGVAEAAAKAGSWSNQQTPALSPVTDALLKNPPDSAWLNWRRTLPSALRTISFLSVGLAKVARMAVR